jgi:hypothetical protein
MGVLFVVVLAVEEFERLRAPDTPSPAPMEECRTWT